MFKLSFLLIALQVHAASDVLIFNPASSPLRNIGSGIAKLLKPVFSLASSSIVKALHESQLIRPPSDRRFDLGAEYIDTEPLKTMESQYDNKLHQELKEAELIKLSHEELGMLAWLSFLKENIKVSESCSKDSQESTENQKRLENGAKVPAIQMPGNNDALLLDLITHINTNSNWAKFGRMPNIKKDLGIESIEDSNKILTGTNSKEKETLYSNTLYQVTRLWNYLEQVVPELPSCLQKILEGMSETQIARLIQSPLGRNIFKAMYDKELLGPLQTLATQMSADQLIQQDIFQGKKIKNWQEFLGELDVKTSPKKGQLLAVALVNKLSIRNLLDGKNDLESVLDRATRMEYASKTDSALGKLGIFGLLINKIKTTEITQIEPRAACRALMKSMQLTNPEERNLLIETLITHLSPEQLGGRVDNGDNALKRAMDEKKFDIAHALIRKMTPADLFEFYPKTDPTVLTITLLSNRFELLPALLSRLDEWTVNDESKKGSFINSVLNIAIKEAEHNQTEKLRILVEHMSMEQIIQGGGQSVFMEAQSKSQTRIMKILSKKIPSIDARTQKSKTKSKDFQGAQAYLAAEEVRKKVVLATELQETIKTQLSGFKIVGGAPLNDSQRLSLSRAIARQILDVGEHPERYKGYGLRLNAGERYWFPKFSDSKFEKTEEIKLPCNIWISQSADGKVIEVEMQGMQLGQGSSNTVIQAPILNIDLSQIKPKAPPNKVRKFEHLMKVVESVTRQSNLAYTQPDTPFEQIPQEIRDNREFRARVPTYIDRKLADGRVEARDIEGKPDWHELPHAQQIQILQDAATTLSLLHQANFVHRDFKLKNIIAVRELQKYRGFIIDWDMLNTTGAQKGSKGTKVYVDRLSYKGVATPLTDIHALAQSFLQLSLPSSRTAEFTALESTAQQLIDNQYQESVYKYVLQDLTGKEPNLNEVIQNRASSLLNRPDSKYLSFLKSLRSYHETINPPSN